MTKYLPAIICLLLFINASFPQPAQKVIDEKTGKSMLIGKCRISDFSDTAFAPWWSGGFNSYKPDTIAADSLRELIKDAAITAVMATWCGDSRREVPRFFRIIDLIGYPSEKINIICVDRKKKGAGSEADNLNIERVPTFIFYREGVEAGRIIESPEASLEKDMIAILRK
jgi:hypothetical protein